MDLREFKENYYITSEEPVFKFFDVQLRDEIDADDDLVSAINDYYEHDEVVPTDDLVTYFIYTIDGEEIYATDQEQELLDKVKELANELD